MNFWPPKPGFTDITRTRSRSSFTHSSVAGVVAGFSAAPAFTGRQPRALADGVQDREAHADVRHEAAVHHVDVDLVGAGRLHARDLLGEDAEVGGQDRGRDPHGHPYITRGAAGRP